ncbi:hypothetical protein Neosp_002932 [[Neocosmospora] mangrovei]
MTNLSKAWHVQNTLETALRILEPDCTTKEYAHKLEERLKRLEESLKPGASSSTDEGHSDHVEGSLSPLLDSETQEPTSTSFTQANPLSQNPTAMHMSPLERLCITESSANQQQWGNPTASFLQMHFIEFIRSTVKTEPFKMELFSPPHSYNKVLTRLEDIVQDISDLYPLLEMSHLQELITPQESDNFVERSARMAICNASLALGVLSPDVDFLRLAQSFLGRVATDDAVRIQKLSEILRICWSPEDEFGPFVPDTLKPRTHNFDFTFA